MQTGKKGHIFACVLVARDRAQSDWQKGLLGPGRSGLASRLRRGAPASLILINQSIILLAVQPY
jgi:hypothetical protein